MVAYRITGVLGYPPSQQPSVDPFTRQPFSQPGTLNTNLEHRIEQELEAEKKEIALDICQFILDMTGVIDPTPTSDGTNAIISLGRGRWVDAVISVVSIVPYIGDFAKLGKLPRYLASIRKAIRIARTDAQWSKALKKLLTQLKKVIDQLYELGADKLPQSANKTLRQIKREIDKFLNPTSGCTVSSETVGDLIANSPKNTHPKAKQKSSPPSKSKEKKIEEKSKEVISSKQENDIITGNGEKNISDDYGVAFFGEDNLAYYTRENASIGREGKSFFLMPLEDSAIVKNASDAARYTGRAPSAEKAYLEGGDVFGLSFPTKGMKATKPIDAGGWPHFLEGGHTAVKTGDGSNAGYLVNPTREFVIPGGKAVPEGSRLFKLGSGGEWMPIRKF